MASERLTITLPSDMARRLKRQAREEKRPVSRLVAEAIAAREYQAYRELMIAGYKESSALNKQLAEEFRAFNEETWPEESWPDG